jgi:Ca2+-binding RTX toxin-like protein
MGEMIRTIHGYWHVGLAGIALAGLLPARAAHVEAAPPTCDGQQATIVGTEHGDRITGTDGRDVIHGLGGDDTIYARAGGDIVCGGEGSDSMRGGDGADKMRGGTGLDVLFGGAGNDDVDGESGTDLVEGLRGNDTLVGEVVEGGEGDDYLITPEGTLRGGPGDDVIRGARFPSYVRASLAMADYGRLSGHGVVVDLNEGTATGEGNDTLININIVRGSQQDDVIIGTADQDVIRPRRGADRVDAGADSDEIEGPSRSDIDADDIVHGGPGHDIIVRMKGRVFGDEDDDIVFASLSADGVDLHGGPGDDRVVGSDFADTLSGNDGEDRLMPGDGDDELRGGPGVDTLEWLLGGQVLVDLELGTVLSSTGDSKLFSVENAEANGVLLGSAGDNKLTGGPGDDTIRGRGGNDTLDGNQEFGTVDNDFCDGGDGTDTATDCENEVDVP